MWAQIVAGLLGLIGNLGKCFASPIERQFKYLCCVNDYKKELEDEAEKLNKEIKRVEEQVEQDKNMGRVITTNAETWLGDAKKIKEEVRENNTETGCLALKSRYVLSKKIEEKTKELMEHRDKPKSFTISHLSPPPPPPPPVVPSEMPASPVQTDEFLSRKKIEDDIVKSLREEENVHILGIWGMGGLGKTTMARKLVKRVEDEKLFDNPFMVAVGQKDMLKIQKDIADWLGLSLKGDTLEIQERQLRNFLEQRDRKRIFIVLDDMWNGLELSALGIPCDKSGPTTCTILVTSRDEEVLNQMNAKAFPMKVLDKDEALSLFKNEVGDFGYDENLVSMAEQVVEECKGLPLALSALSRALKNQKKEFMWSNVLQKLKDRNMISEPLSKVYPSLRLSYEYLSDPEERFIFLLCSQFAKDSDISLRELALYSMSLRQLSTDGSVEQTKVRARAITETLKSRSLLLDGKDINHVKMHDVVRDVAIVIAQEEGRNDASPCSGSVVECEWIFLFPTGHEHRYQLVGSNYPRLALLAIQGHWKKPSTIIEEHPSLLDGMKELRSLSFNSVSINSFPQTMTSMKNLLMLRLVNCNLECISIIGELLGLEVFVCSDCDQIKELPDEIGGLKLLKVLEVTNCSNLERIAAGVISNLTELEEFILWRSFQGWESTEIEERRNASLQEFMSLTKLKLLWIHIQNFEQKLLLPPSIINYRIFIGDDDYHAREWIVSIHNCQKSTKLDPKRIHQLGSTNLHLQELAQDFTSENWIHQLVSTSEDLYASINFDVSQIDSNIIKFLEIRDTEMVEELIHSTNWRSSGGAFPVLESLELCNLPNLKKIYDGSVPEESISFKNLEMLQLIRLYMLSILWKVPNQNASLNNLCEIQIQECNKLQNLFFVERAKDAFLKLKKLDIYWCEMMEEVLYSDGNENENEGTNSYGIKFPKLEELNLRRLPCLKTFAKGIECMQFPLLWKLEIEECPKLRGVVCSNGREENPVGNNNENVDVSPIFNDGKVKFGSLTNLRIYECGSIKILFSLQMAENLVNLKQLEIESCHQMERVIADVGEVNGSSIINQTSLSNLSSITISDCGKLRHLLQLESLQIKSCKRMEHIFSNEENGKLSRITFSKLERFELEDLASLTTLFNGVESIDFPILEQMDIRCCPNLVSIIPFTGCNHMFCCPKVTFGGLKRLKIRNWNKIRNVWCHQILPCFFRGLEELTIGGCGGIKILFSLQIAENLVNLEELQITDCNQMEKVIGDVGEMHEISTLFPRLRILDLNRLPSFKMFCECKRVVLQSLAWISIDECPMVEVLTPGSLRVPKLHFIELNSKDLLDKEWNEREDLNSFIRGATKEPTSNEDDEEEEEEEEII